MPLFHSVPPHPSSLDFRHLLTDAIESFLATQRMPSPETAAVLAEIAVVLAHYREEGTALHPLVVLCERLDVVMAHLGAGRALVLGEGPEAPDTARRAVKVCAPLALGGWSSFLDREGGRLRFGVFHADDFVLRETPLEVLRRTEDPSLRAVGVVRVAAEVIELRGGAGPSCYVQFSGARDGAAPPSGVSRELLSSLTRDCSPEARVDLLTFYRSVLLDVMRASHGTLIAVMARDAAPDSLFPDGVFLPAPLDLGESVAAYRAVPSEAAHSALQGFRVLLRGMMMSDGVTVLRSDGAIVGFNVFLPHAATNARRTAAESGGARRRTFEALVARLGRGLDAAFYRSQDGHAECQRATG